MFCFVALANSNTGTMYTDLTGAFLVRSFKNMQYIFVTYIDNINAILVQTLPLKNDDTTIMAFTNILAILSAQGYKPTLNVIDNECSKSVATHHKTNHLDIHLVPPNKHQVNEDKHAIVMLMEHFITGLAMVDKDCPI
jgi:hypothetical protein